MGTRRRKGEVSKRLSAIHDVTPRLQGFKSLLKELRFRCVRLRQQTRKIVERLTMIGIHFNHVSLQVDQNSPLVVVWSGGVRSKFYRLREFLQRTLEIKLIGESYTQIQVCIRRPRIKLDDSTEVRDSLRRLAKPSEHHGSR